MGTFVTKISSASVDTGATEAQSLVKTKFDDSASYAQQALDNALLYATDLSNVVTALAAQNIKDISKVTLNPIAPIDYAGFPVPGVPSSNFTTIVKPAPVSPNLDKISSVSTAGLPSKTFNFIPGTPVLKTVNTIGSPTALATPKAIVIPTKPTFNTPTPFTPTTITLPTVPNFQTINFSVSPPALAVINNPAGFSYTEGAYNSSIWTDLFGKVLSDIKNGGTGLDATVEADIYARGIARQVTENDRLYQQVIDVQGSSGFNLPTGALASNTAEVLSDISRKNDLLNKEITVQQADLAQKNTHFALTIGADLEKMLREFFIQQQNRTLDASKALAQSGVDIFNVLVSKANLDLENYKSEAVVYELRIKAEAEKADQYKAQIEGSKVEATVQGLQVDVYSKQVEVVGVLAKLYSTEMESAKIQVDVQRTQIDNFRSTVEAYALNLNAEKIKVDTYAEEVNLENVKADTYGKDVQAFAAQVSVEQAKINTGIENKKLKLQNNANLIDEYKASLAAYESEISAELKKAGLDTDQFLKQVSSYNAVADLYTAQNGVKIKEIQAQIEDERLNLEKGVAEVKATLEGYTAFKELEIKGTAEIMNVNAQLAAAAMNAVNASASVGFSGSGSNSASYGFGQDLRESHSFTEK